MGNQGVARDEDGRIGAGPGEGVSGHEGHAGAGGADTGLGEDSGVGYGEAETVRGVSLGNYKEVNFLDIHNAMDEGGFSSLFAVLAEGLPAHVPGTYSKAT